MQEQNTNSYREARTRLRLWITGLCIMLLYAVGATTRLDYIAQDAITAFSAETLPSNITIVEIDSFSLAQNNQWPWDRTVYVKLLHELQTAQPNSMFLDIDFSATTNTNSDNQLAQAIDELAKTTTVRLPTFRQPQSTRSQTFTLRRPLDIIGQSAKLVSVNMHPANDGLVRQVTTGIVAEDDFFPSVWTSLSGKTEGNSIINYAISPESFDYRSFHQVVEQGLTAGELRGKDVLIGATAIELGDSVPVPVYQSVAGVVFQAIAIETLLRGGLHALSLTAAIVALFLLGFISASASQRLSWLRGLLFVGLCFGVVAAGSIYAFNSLQLLLPSASLCLMVLGLYIVSLTTKLDFSLLQNFWLRTNLLKQESLLGSIFSASNDSIVCVDDKGKVLSANARCETVFGCEAGRLIDKALTDIMPSAREGLERLDKQAFETYIIDHAGHHIPVEACISPITLSGKTSYTLALRDIRERKERERALNFAVTHDKLTGLLNRVRFFELVEEEIQQHLVAAIIKLDIDYFNEINEVYGHAFGDQLLKAVGKRLLNSLEPQALMGRIAKDDFAILIVDKSTRDISLLVEKLLGRLHEPFTIGDHTVSIFTHIGIAYTSDKPSNVEELVRLSNIALQSAKNKGQEYDFCYTDDHHAEPQQLNMIGMIRQSLLADDFKLAFQPKVRLDSGEPVGTEVLLRLPTADDRDIDIGKLVEVVETTPLIAELTLKIVARILSMERDWKLGNLPAQISINLSLGLLANDKFIADLIQLLDASIGYFKIEFEITETSFTDSWQRSLNNIDRLMSRSVSLAIDDFGIGYSSLAYLRDLRAKVLKIDKSFIENIHLKLENQSIVQSTIKMAHELGMKVVAEGVESPQERKFLLACGCDYGQGFFFAKPMFFDRFAAWIQTKSVKNVLILPRKTDSVDS